jgi:hypothetical protein
MSFKIDQLLTDSYYRKLSRGKNLFHLMFVPLDVTLFIYISSSYLLRMRRLNVAEVTVCKSYGTYERVTSTSSIPGIGLTYYTVSTSTPAFAKHKQQQITNFVLKGSDDGV